jgi:hypothetical protein
MSGSKVVIKLIDITVYGNLRGSALASSTLAFSDPHHFVKPDPGSPQNESRIRFRFKSIAGFGYASKLKAGSCGGSQWSLGGGF